MRVHICVAEGGRACRRDSGRRRPGGVSSGCVTSTRAHTEAPPRYTGARASEKCQAPPAPARRRLTRNVKPTHCSNCIAASCVAASQQLPARSAHAIGDTHAARPAAWNPAGGNEAFLPQAAGASPRIANQHQQAVGAVHATYHTTKRKPTLRGAMSLIGSRSQAGCLERNTAMDDSIGGS